MVNRVRIHPLFATSERAIVIAANGKHRTIDGRDRNMPAPPLDLAGLENDCQILAAKLQRAANQLAAMNVAQEQAVADIHTREENGRLLEQNGELAARLMLIREELRKWDAEDQPSNKTLRALMAVMDMDA